MDRMTIFPSRYNLIQVRQRILAATRGLNLLKRKRDALELKLRELAAELKIAEEKVLITLQEALFSIAKANYLMADLKPMAVQHADRADVYLRIRSGRVAGVLLPNFELIMRPPRSYPLTGLSRGGEQVEMVRSKFQDAIRILVRLASLQFSVKVLKEGARQNNMRINGLDYVVIPRLKNTATYILNELDEVEREEFYRLKRSQAKQRKAKAAFAEIVKRLKMSSDEPESEEARMSAHINEMIKKSVMDQKFNLSDFTSAGQSMEVITKSGLDDISMAASEEERKGK